MFHVKCMVGWQELSLHRKASRGSLDPYTENVIYKMGLLKGLTLKELSLQEAHEDVGKGGGHLGAHCCSEGKG